MARISAFTVVVPDYDTAIAFYIGALGFDLLEDTRLSDTKRWVRVAPPGAETAILLAQPKNDLERTAIGNQTGGRVGFFLEVEDFDAAYKRMKAHAVDFREAPRSEPYGKVVVFADPFENLWDLIEPAS
ncbi:VOC family protein [Henriciella marina]|uniref:VOC family protein n=1 Tax=Henriciella marina TaxID=453851 RepID=UPI000360E98A|nr:VOC family protein [Henriciella marina]